MLTQSLTLIIKVIIVFFLVIQKYIYATLICFSEIIQSSEIAKLFLEMIIT